MEGKEALILQGCGGDLTEWVVGIWDFDSWDIQTEVERFVPKIAGDLPPLCFSTLGTTSELICIKRGESGYYPSDWSTSDPAANKELADFNNTV